MTRQVTDNLYIELGYFTPEEYYVYEANANAGFASAATFACSADAGSIQSGEAALSASVSVSVTATRIKEFAAGFTGVFSPSMTAVAIVNLGSSVNVVATLSVSAVRNRAVDIALDNIANLAAQSARTRDSASGLAVSATLSAELSELVLVDFAATLTTTATLTAQGKGFVISSPVVFRGVGRPEINYTVTKFGAGSLFLNGTNSYLYSPDKNTRFDILSSASVNPAGQFTVEAWIYPTAVNRTALIVGQWQGNSSSTQGWKLEQLNREVTLTVRTGSSTTQSIGTGSSTPLNVNAWNHIAVVRGTNNGVTDIAIWVNGVRRNSASWSNASFANTGEVRIGYSGETGTTYFQGYIDAVNFRVGSARYNTFTTPITQPTAEYTSIDDSDRILVNFNDNYLDSSTPNNVTFNATLTSAFTQSATAQKAILASANLSSAFAQSALGGKLIDFNADLPVIASQLSAVGKVGQAVIACDVVTSLSASAQVSRGLDAAQSSAFTQTATAFNIKQFASALSTTVTVTAVADSGKLAEADLDSTVSLTASAERTRDVNSNQTTQATLSAQVTATLQAQSALSTTVALACDASRTRPFEAALPVIASQLSAVGKVGNTLVDFAVTATVSVSAIAGKIVIANLNTIATLSASVNRTRDLSSAVSSVSTLTVTGVVVKEVNSNISTAFTQTVAGTAIKRADSVQSSAFTLFTTLSGLQQGQATLSAQASQSASAVATRSGQANLPVIASQLTAVTETSSLTAALSSTFTLQCQAIEVKIDPDLTYMIPQEIRSYMIIEELRVHDITPELRTHTIATS